MTTDAAIISTDHPDAVTYLTRPGSTIVYEEGDIRCAGLIWNGGNRAWPHWADSA